VSSMAGDLGEGGPRLILAPLATDKFSAACWLWRARPIWYSAAVRSRRASLGSNSVSATWRSGDATVCKTVNPGSIPGVASIFPYQVVTLA
jgi:hypothetical protein